MKCLGIFDLELSIALCIMCSILKEVCSNEGSFGENDHEVNFYVVCQVGKIFSFGCVYRVLVKPACPKFTDSLSSVICGNNIYNSDSICLCKI